MEEKDPDRDVPERADDGRRSHDDLAATIEILRAEVRQRQLAETALRESEARVRTLLEHAPEAIVVLDVDEGVFCDANDNACRLFGMSREELLRHGPLELSPPTQPGGASSLEEGEKNIERALRTFA